MGRRGVLLAFVIAAVVLVRASRSASASTGHRATRPEAQVEAEFIERFTRFVDWSRLPDTMRICVVGDSPITAYLNEIARRQLVKGKRARVATVAAEALVGCQVVVIAGDDGDRLRAVIARTEGRPILSIADAPGAAEAGAIINFYLDDQHVRFEINLGAARRDGLILHSKLLQLARIVPDREPSP